MKHFKQYKPLVIEEVSESKFHYPPHHQNYYELVYIKEGSGNSHINNAKLSYKAGDLFFVATEDDHYFDVLEHTTFIFIKFTNDYLKNVNTLNSLQYPVTFEPLALFNNQYLKEHGLHLNTNEKKRINNCIQDIMQHNISDIENNSLVLYCQILVILSTVYEYLKKTGELVFSTENINSELLDYIHQNIYAPEQLLVSNVSNLFSISEQYFSAWFKQTYLVSYKNYIDSYRIELIKNRLTHTSASIQIIGDEFGFSDSSHFSNYFYKHVKVRPLQYRKEALTRKIH